MSKHGGQVTPVAACLALLWASVLPQAALASGLWDPGFRNGGWRSDFDDPLQGTSLAPIQYAEPCAYPGIRFALCPTTFRPLPGVDAPPSWFGRSNWQDATRDEQGRFWVVGANTEPALHEPCNSGPPNQSEAVAAPNDDVYGIDVAPAGAGVRPARSVLRLALDLRHRPAQLAERPDCVPFDFIPYLGYGVQSDRGAGVERLARIGSDEAEVIWKFATRLEASDAETFDRLQGPPDRPKGQHAGVWIEAQWGGHRRWVWIELFNAYELAEETYFSPWNWAIPESFHFPGAEIVITSGRALADRCPAFHGVLPSTEPAAWASGNWLSVRIPLDALFACIGDLYSTPYPVGQSVDVTGLHFWVEVGVRDIDAEPGLSTGDYDSHLTIAFADADLLPESLPVLDDSASLVQLAFRRLLLRSPGAEELTHSIDVVDQHGAAALIEQLVDHRGSSGSLGAAARLQLLGWGVAADHALLRRHAHQLAEARLGRLVANEVARDPRFTMRWGRHWDEAAVLALLREAHDPVGLDEREAQQRLASQWSGRMQRGLTRVGDLLWLAVEQSYASDAMNAKARSVQAYSALLSRVPSIEEQLRLEREPRRALAVVEDLVWSAEFRRSHLPPSWTSTATTTKDSAGDVTACEVSGRGCTAPYTRHRPSTNSMR